MKILKRWWWLLPLALFLALAAFLVWALAVPAPMPEALAALQSSTSVQVETEPWLVFRPVDHDPAVGLILYPGGRVDARAYAPAARAVAEEGYLVAIVPMPLNLAFFAPDRAAEVMAAFPETGHWAVGSGLWTTDYGLPSAGALPTYTSSTYTVPSPPPSWSYPLIPILRAPWVTSAAVMKLPV